MVRRGWLSGLVVPAVLLLGCSDDGGDEPPTTSAGPVTLPDDVEAGTGELVLDGERILLTVRACDLAPATDEATGVVTDLAIDADDGISLAVSLTRTTTPVGEVATVNDVITVADQADPDAPEVLEAERADVGGRYVDLLAEGALTPLLEVEGELVSAEGVFGPVGARPGAEGVVEGSLLVRCPPGS